MSNVVYSVIVPHHEDINGIQQLLQSIPKLERIEVIIVDDHSSQEIFSQLERIVAEHNELDVTLLSNTGGRNGAGAARNIGLQSSKGEWILFADSDDVFTENAKSVIEHCKDDDAEIVFFPPTSVDSVTGEMSDRHIFFENLVQEYINNPDKKRELLVRAEFSSCWSKMLRKELLTREDIWFEEIPLANDVQFATKAGIKAKAISVVNETVYCIIRREKSITTDSSLEKFLFRFHIQEEKYDYLRKELSTEEFELLDLSFSFWIVVAYRNGYGLRVVLDMIKELHSKKMKIGLVRLTPKKVFKHMFEYVKKTKEYKF